MNNSPAKNRLRLAATLAAFYSIGAHAAWEAVPKILMLAQAEDNPRLNPDALVSNSSVASSAIEAGVTASTFNQRGFLVLAPRARSNIYSNADDDLSGTDLFLRGRGEYRWAAAEIGFRTDYRLQSVQRSELAGLDDPTPDVDEGLSNSPDVDSGRLIFIDQDQERLTVQPYVEFVLSERSRIRVETQHTEVSYTQGNNILRTGFNDTTVRVGIVRRVSERNRVSATLLASTYEALANANTTDTVGVEGAIRRNVTDLWSMDLTVGVERNNFVYETPAMLLVDNADVNYTAMVRASKRAERSRLDLSVGRATAPSSSGFVTVRDEFRTYFNLDLTPRLSTRFGFRLSQSSSIGGKTATSERDYSRYEFGIDWALTQKWVITSALFYTAQQFQTEVDRNSTRLSIGFQYQGLARPGAPR